MHVCIYRRNRAASGSSVRDGFPGEISRVQEINWGIYIVCMCGCYGTVYYMHKRIMKLFNFEDF